MEQNLKKMVDLILDRIHRLDTPVIVAIDGRCGSGKSTLAAALAEELHCPVVPMDDFFLRPSQRTPERFAEPGGNVDRERFLREVLIPLSMGAPLAYRPFRCSTRNLGELRELGQNAITIVEGSYSSHPDLRDYYGLKVFLTTDSQTQLRRIEKRSGAEKLQQFKERWIPLEEAYFSTLDTDRLFDLVFFT